MATKETSASLRKQIADLQSQLANKSGNRSQPGKRIAHKGGDMVCGHCGVNVTEEHKSDSSADCPGCGNPLANARQV